MLAHDSLFIYIVTHFKLICQGLKQKKKTGSSYRIPAFPLSVLKMMKTLHRHYKHGRAANLDFDWIWHVRIYCHT